MIKVCLGVGTTVYEIDSATDNGNSVIEDMKNELENLEIFVPMLIEVQESIEFKIKETSWEGYFDQDPQIYDFYLSFESDYTFTNDSTRDYYITTYENQRDYITPSEIIEKRMRDFAFAVSLSYPGLFSVREIVVDIDGVRKKYQSSMLIGFLDGVRQRMIKEPWPSFEKVSILGTWQWLQNSTHFFEETGDCAIDIAINSLTQLICKEDESSIFYVMLAIEAIYNTDESWSIGEQIRRKLAYLFGETQATRKSINEMYRQRSKLIHGQTYLPQANGLLEDSERNIRHLLNQTIPTLYFAESILIATFRKMIKNKASSIQLDQSLKFTDLKK